MEADDVVREDALVDVLADVARQHAPGVRLGPRDVDEVVEEQVGALARGSNLRRRVEVVVVEHHDGVARPSTSSSTALGEVLVDHAVALLVGVDLVLADVRRVREVPEVVLDEPQHRVRDDVVEARRRRPGRTRPAGSGSWRRRARISKLPAVVLAARPRCPRRSSPTRPRAASRWWTRPVSAVTSPPPPRAARARRRLRARTSRGRGSRRGRAGASWVIADP